MRRGGVLPVRSYQPETYKIKQTMIISAPASAVDQRLNPSMKQTDQASKRKEKTQQKILSSPSIWKSTAQLGADRDHLDVLISSAFLDVVKYLITYGK